MWSKTLSLEGEGAFLVLILLLAACQAQAPDTPFPQAQRDVAPIVGDAFSTEDARDRLGEAEEVIALVAYVLSDEFFP